jgi:hypothetical protein
MQEVQTQREFKGMKYRLDYISKLNTYLSYNEDYEHPLMKQIREMMTKQQAGANG